MLYFLNAQGPRTSKLIFTTVKYTNTQIQIHKYSFVEVPGIPNICYISKQLLIQGCQKWYSQLSKVIRSDIRSDIRDLIVPLLTSDFCIVPPGLFVTYFSACATNSTFWVLLMCRAWSRVLIRLPSWQRFPGWGIRTPSTCSRPRLLSCGRLQSQMCYRVSY